MACSGLMHPDERELDHLLPLHHYKVINKIGQGAFGEVGREMQRSTLFIVTRTEVRRAFLVAGCQSVAQAFWSDSSAQTRVQQKSSSRCVGRPSSRVPILANARSPQHRAAAGNL